MRKTTLDLVILLVFFILISIFSDNTDIATTLLQIGPLIFIVLFGLLTNFKASINFLVFFLVLFISYSFDSGTVDWTSYVIYAVMAIFFAGVFSRLLAIDKKNQNTTHQLKGSYLGFLHKKWPNASNLSLFIGDAFLSSLSILILFSVLFSPLPIKSIVLIIIVCCYFSISNIYFYFILPKKKL